MDFLKDIFDIYNFEIMISMGFMIVILLVLNISNRVKINSTIKKYNELNRFLTAGNSKSMEDALIEYIKEVNFMKNSLDSLEDKFENINEKINKAIQKIGFIRYNAFDDMGSDLSFSVALLDDNLNGFVITNIYARDESNVYAKPVTAGHSTYALSSEEIEAVERAMIGHKKATQ